jgi:signal transduction histidine kinase
VATIVRAMKNFAHPGDGEKRAVDINAALENTITVAKNEWKYVAEVVTDFDALPMVQCLPGDINQVFLNILINAAHAIGDVVGNSGDKGTITIATRRGDHEVVVSIADTGTGISPEIRDKIFNPFFTTKEVGKGTGQGLAIVHDIIVERHGGVIDVESEPGRGTTFIIRLPAGE